MKMNNILNYYIWYLFVNRKYMTNINGTLSHCTRYEGFHVERTLSQLSNVDIWDSSDDFT